MKQLLRYIAKRKNEINKDLKAMSGSIHSVEIVMNDVTKVFYKIRCHIKKCDYHGFNVDRHLKSFIHDGLLSQLGYFDLDKCGYIIISPR